MDKLTQTALQTLQRYNFIKNGNTVIVALSGGADSVALFHFLFSHTALLGITLRACHVHHGVRGAAADADAAFVAEMCKAYAVPLDIVYLTPPPAFSENWGRQKRYEAFAKLAQEHHALIATAHTRSDNAETVLLHLTRGASVHGAAGIPPVRGNVIRPFLAVSRTEVERYTKEHSLAFCADESNFDTSFARNRVRHAVLPQLCEISPCAEQAIALFAQDMRETADYLDKQAEALLAEACVQTRDGACAYQSAVLLAAESVVRRTALRSLLTAHVDATRSRILRVEALLQTEGSDLLTDHVCLSVNQGLLRVEPMFADAHLWRQDCAAGEFTAADGQLFTVLIQSNEVFVNFANDGENCLKFCGDYDKIGKAAVFRTLQSGDCFCGVHGGTKPVRKLLSEAKIGLQARQTLPMLACGSTVLWIAGFGFAKSVAASADTKQVIQIEKMRRNYK